MERGIGHGALGMGHWAWGMGHGALVLSEVEVLGMVFDFEIVKFMPTKANSDNLKTESIFSSCLYSQK
ncbi:hypothetical protein [Halotia branconii]|uniref:Uncharacterized protein n=1 Tax=Halotia branconii CENA392 TaxID=1539056 RepID=A0AAJ6NUQ9_9CYAN|nr:hypothetical protein [Halotia branconii]WGV26992.1 hypothetical protein QI031_05730 [Halotia branconii CENA392]